MKNNDSFLLWRKEFYEEFFYDDLTSGVPETVETFRNIIYLMEQESLLIHQ